MSFSDTGDGYADFWTLTERAVDFAFARAPSVNRALRPKLLDACMKLDAFPDARSTLTGLKAQGAHVAILFNGSPGMLGAALFIVADDLRQALRADGNRLRLHGRQQLRRYEPALLQRRNLLVNFVDREARVRTDVEIESHQDHRRA